MKAILKIALYISLGIYLMALTGILFFGSRGLGFAHELTILEYFKLRSNFVPFRTISGCIQAIFDGTMNRDIPIKNLLGNLLLFLPMGLYLPVFIHRLHKFDKFLLAIFFLLMSVETIQVLLKIGSFDVDDMILNLLGAICGFFIFKLFFKRAKQVERLA